MINIEDIIVYEDNSLILLNKPSGLRTIPDGYNIELSNLLSLLKIKYPTVMTVHRLDKETSGLIIFALNQDIHRKLNSQFEKREIKKKYYAITHNIPDWCDYSATFPLIIDGDRKHRTVVDQNGKIAQTFFRKVHVNEKRNIALIEASPMTGYTHQIRTHLSHLGFPIYGDILYSRGLSASQKELNNKSNRIMLHACFITFFHPQKNQLMTFETKIPFRLEDF